jgi:hypothetical protein
VKSRRLVKASWKGWAHLGMSSHRCAAARCGLHDLAVLRFSTGPQSLDEILDAAGIWYGSRTPQGGGVFACGLVEHRPDALEPTAAINSGTPMILMTRLP